MGRYNRKDRPTKRENNGGGDKNVQRSGNLDGERQIRYLKTEGIEQEEQKVNRDAKNRVTTAGELLQSPYCLTNKFSDVLWKITCMVAFTVAKDLFHQ